VSKEPDEPIRIVSYDPQWPVRYEEERAALEAGIGPWVKGGLAGLGYLYAPYRVEQMHWFCKPEPSRRTHHLHLVPTGSTRFGHDREAYTDAKASFIERVLGTIEGEARCQS
jgi:GrpB-like predicted nucleotidyltransferase (UPF0157 family)